MKSVVLLSKDGVSPTNRMEEIVAINLVLFEPSRCSDGAKLVWAVVLCPTSRFGQHAGKRDPPCADGRTLGDDKQKWAKLRYRLIHLRIPWDYVFSATLKKPQRG